VPHVLRVYGVVDMVEQSELAKRGVEEGSPGGEVESS
jgi:hypothetical protein